MTRSSAHFQTALAARVGHQELPLLAADSLSIPRYLVLLNDTTWKWAMNPDPRVRYEYRLLWNTVLAWLVGEEAEGFRLTIDPEPMADRPGFTRIMVRPRNPAALPALRDVTLRFEADGRRSTLPVRFEEDAWVGVCPPPDELPAIVWLQAEARYRDDTWRSQRRPLLLPGDAIEFGTTRPSPELLAELAADPKRTAYATDAMGVLKALMRPPEARAPEPQVRDRSPRAELLLAVLLVLLLAVEWLVERTLDQRS